MKLSRLPTVILLAAAATAVGTLSVAREQSSAPAPKAREAKASLGLVKSFEFFGCSGDWTDEGGTPDVWRVGSKSGVYFLVRHPDTCGYTIGSKPKASLSGTSLELGYELSNDDGILAACPCEYWARFELSSAPAKLTKVTVNGEQARLKGGLAAR